MRTGTIFFTVLSLTLAEGLAQKTQMGGRRSGGEEREKGEKDKKEEKGFQKKGENSAEEGKYLSDEATRVKHNICALR